MNLVGTIQIKLGEEYPALIIKENSEAVGKGRALFVDRESGRFCFQTKVPDKGLFEGREIHVMLGASTHLLTRDWLPCLDATSGHDYHFKLIGALSETESK